MDEKIKELLELLEKKYGNRVINLVDKYQKKYGFDMQKKFDS